MITSVILKIAKAGLQGASPFLTLGSIAVDIKKGPFSNNVALQLTDFQLAASKNSALTIANAPVGVWYSGTLAATNHTYLNRAGVTQFRLRFTTDDNNNRRADFLKFYSGNYGTLSYRPALIIKYYLP